VLVSACGSSRSRAADYNIAQLHQEIPATPPG
jgi:hypothetical protein